MSDLLSTGASGLRAYSRALATIGDNIANAQTPGYARRTLALRDVQTGSNAPLLRPHVTPGGVEVSAVTRATDEWLQAEARLSSGEDERTRLRLATLSDVESALADEQNGIVTGLSALFTTADQLTADPNSSTLRTRFLGAVDTVAAGFRTVATRLSGLANSNLNATAIEVTQLNDDLAALETVNLGLRKARTGSAGAASLLDERDRLLDRISSRMDVSASFGQHGSVTLRAAGGGGTLVESSGFHPVAAASDADGRIGFLLAGQSITIASGSLAGLASASNHIADQRIGVDQQAGIVADQFNRAHQAGTTPSGAAGGALFIVGGSAATLAAAPLPPEAVAAANARGDNGNMLAFASLRGAGGPESLWADTLARQSQATSSGKAQQSAAATRVENATMARDNVSAVDLDREAADLVRFQQAYTAAAQTIQIARETMQTLLNLI